MDRFGGLYLIILAQDTYKWRDIVRDIEIYDSVKTLGIC